MYQDLLLTLLGFPSDFIIVTPSPSDIDSIRGGSQIPEPTFRVKEGYTGLFDSDREQIDKIVPLGWYYQQLQAYTDHYDLSWGNINKETEIYKLALSSAVKDLLLEYVEDITVLEDALNSSEHIPLSHFIRHLQKVEKF